MQQARKGGMDGWMQARVSGLTSFLSLSHSPLSQLCDGRGQLMLVCVGSGLSLSRRLCRGEIELAGGDGGMRVIKAGTLSLFIVYAS